ncbi:MAG: hypothetical protein IKV40_07920 [Clostridia bacterium]|nr:hypothetical protein [Clostridia bacterium]
MKHDNRCKHTPYGSDSFKVFNPMEKYYIRRCKKCRKLIQQPVICLPLLFLNFLLGIILLYFTEVSFSSVALLLFCGSYIISALFRVLPWREVREDELKCYDGDASLYFKEKQRKYDKWLGGIVYVIIIAICLQLQFA